jgi:hypothetical protein
VEEGGNVFADGVSFYRTPAYISGVVADSAGKPLPRARVALGGSPFETTSDDTGRFGFDSLPSGAYTLLVRNRDYNWLGMLAADTSVTVNEGDRLSLTLHMKGTSQIVARMCELAPPTRHREVLRLLFRHRDSGLPLVALRVNLFWLTRQAVDQGKPNDIVRIEGEKSDGIQWLTDKDGAVNFCGIPPDVPLFIRPLLPTLQVGLTVAQCVVRKGEVTVRVVRTVAPTVPLFPEVRLQDLLNAPSCSVPRSENDPTSHATPLRRGRYQPSFDW